MPRFVYVEMCCKLDQIEYQGIISTDGIVVEAIDTVELDILFDCYIDIFDKGDAKFF